MFTASVLANFAKSNPITTTSQPDFATKAGFKISFFTSVSTKVTKKISGHSFFVSPFEQSRRLLKKSSNVKFVSPDFVVVLGNK